MALTCNIDIFFILSDWYLESAMIEIMCIFITLDDARVELAGIEISQENITYLLVVAILMEE